MPKMGSGEKMEALSPTSHKELDRANDRVLDLGGRSFHGGAKGHRDCIGRCHTYVVTCVT